MNWIKKGKWVEFDKLVDLFLKVGEKIWKFFPRSVRYLTAFLVILILVYSIIAAVLGLPSIWQIAKSFKQQNIVAKERIVKDESPLVKGVELDCNIDFCSDFTNSQEWDGYEYFDRLKGEGVILLPQVSEALPGRMIFFREKTNPDFIAKLKIQPLFEESPNLVFQYANYRCIIGDGNYRAFTC